MNHTQQVTTHATQPRISGRITPEHSGSPGSIADLADERPADADELERQVAWQLWRAL